MNYPTNNPKNWWSPLWKGLVVDPEAKHYRRMKSALWLFAYFLLHADRQSGSLKRKLKTMSLDTGIKARTIRGWVALLKRQGYIETRSNGRCLLIKIAKWKGLKRQNYDNESGLGKASRVLQSCQSAYIPRGPDYPQSSRNPVNARDPNDISLKKYLITNYMSNMNNKIVSADELKTSKQFVPQDRAEQLALDLANGLDDRKGLLLYDVYARKYPESFLRTTLATVKEIPIEKITKSRAALFNYLVKRYAKKRNEHPGDQSGN